MATKKKRSKPAQVESLTVRHLARMREDMAAHSAELLGVVNEFKTEMREDMAEFKTEIRKDMAVHSAELLGVVNEFKTEVASAFRELQEKVVEVAVDIAQATADMRAADRARIDGLEERIANLEKRAS